MALMMCGFCPEIFRADGAYVPITDLECWTEQNSGYRPHIVACCVTAEEMRARSPISYVDNISRANLKIFHGKYDSVVPVTHSMELYAQIFEKYPNSRVFLDIFDGGHEIDMTAAMYWIMSQYEGIEKSEITR